MLLPSPILIRRAKKRRESEPDSEKKSSGCAPVFFLIFGLLLVISLRA